MARPRMKHSTAANRVVGGVGASGWRCSWCYGGESRLAYPAIQGFAGHFTTLLAAMLFAAAAFVTGLRFSLRTLLIAMTLVAVVLGLIVWGDKVRH